MPHANSRFSRPRAISPSASDGTLPCSAVSSAAISLRWASTRFRIRNMTSVRFDSDVARQAGKAALAAATAAATSSTDAKSTYFVTLPGRGVVDGTLAPGRAGHDAPPIQWLTRPGGGASACWRSRLCDLCHRNTILCVGTTTILLGSSSRAARVSAGQNRRSSSRVAASAEVGPASAESAVGGRRRRSTGSPAPHAEHDEREHAQPTRCRSRSARRRSVRRRRPDRATSSRRPPGPRPTGRSRAKNSRPSRRPNAPAISGQRQHGQDAERRDALERL